MVIIEYTKDMQHDVEFFLQLCFSNVGMKYEPLGRHHDVADIENCYMRNGCFWCMVEDERIVGTVAVRELEQGVYELKRLFVLPSKQNLGYGGALIKHAISYAKARGAKCICLDTQEKYKAAHHLYEKYGFKQTERYNDNVHADRFYKLDLACL